MKIIYTILLMTIFVNCYSQSFTTVTLTNGKTISVHPRFKTTEALFAIDSSEHDVKIMISSINRPDKIFCNEVKNLTAGQDLISAANQWQAGAAFLFAGTLMSVIGAAQPNFNTEYFVAMGGISLIGLCKIVHSHTFIRRAGIKMDAKLIQ